MLASREETIELLRCPHTQSKLRRSDGDRLVCRVNGASPDFEYPIIQGVPILINFSNSVLSEKETSKSVAKSVVERKKHKYLSGLIKRLLSPEKKSTRKNVDQLIERLLARSESPSVLVIGGGTIGQGMAPLYDHPTIKVFALDIYASPLVHLVADAHQIPLPDGQFDAVVIQAVLEHTLQPQEVVDGIWRVLKPEGLVYAETPFMQQVHEGAYDFTRFSESGHRYLFRRFELLSSGANGGPGLQFMWSADYLARSVFRSRLAGKLAKLAFFWAQYLDLLIPESYAMDAASGVYFLGRKSNEIVSPIEIIQHYKGAQQ